MRKVGERHVLDYHLNFLFSETFPFFPFQVGIDFSQPHGNSFSLVGFLRKILNTYDISPSPYFFISSCPLLFSCCFSFLLGHTDIFFFRFSLADQFPLLMVCALLSIQLGAFILLCSLIMLSQLCFLSKTLRILWHVPLCCRPNSSNKGQFVTETYENYINFNLNFTLEKPQWG